MMTKAKLKNLRDQVIVITGGSSGIGMATAKRAARAGAATVLTGRKENALREVAEDIRRGGGRSESIVADVADFQAMKNVADFALEKFGRFDTWINNAGVHIFGRIDQTPLADARRLFEVNYWGVVHGCRAAVPFLRNAGGAIINVGSALSDRSIPLQGYYGASKHAVMGYTDSLRMELEAEGAPISLTFIRPGPIHTPIPEHSRNVTEESMRLPYPLYGPEVAAKAILFCAEHTRRSLAIGGAAKMAEIGEHYFPLLTDFTMRHLLFDLQKTSGPRREQDILHRAPDVPPRERGNQDLYAARSSAYTEAVMHPFLTAAVAAVGAGLAALVMSRGRQS